MDNNCVKYYPDPTIHGSEKLWPAHRFSVCVHCDLGLGGMTLGQGHEIPLGRGQQLCEILSRSNMAMRSYDRDTDLFKLEWGCSYGTKYPPWQPIPNRAILPNRARVYRWTDGQGDSSIPP